MRAAGRDGLASAGTAYLTTSLYKVISRLLQQYCVSMTHDLFTDADTDPSALICVYQPSLIAPWADLISPARTRCIRAALCVFKTCVFRGLDVSLELSVEGDNNLFVPPCLIHSTIKP
jgi:hypothetical protein